MRRFAYAMCVLLAVSCSIAAQAGVYTFVPNPTDMRDLSHNEWYMWKFTWSAPAGEQITEATLTFKDITNWRNESYNRLQVHLINDPSTSGWTYLNQRTEYGKVQRTYVRTDNDNSSDNFASWTNQKLVGIYSDRDGVYHEYSASSDPDITFTFSDLANICYDSNGNPINIDPDPNPTDLIPTLNAWAADGNWALGFDPDCHFYNNGITFTVTTAPTPPDQPIPEPATIVLASLGMSAMLGARRMRRK